MHFTKEDCLNYEDALNIQNVSERVFALYLLTFKNLLIWYEPFSVNESVPDFLIKNSNYPNSPGSIVEITLLSKDKLNGRKKRQKERFANCGFKSTILCLENLKQITKAHPTLNFYNGSKT